jgi:phosphoribosyl 1,2-cyclic phosphate phosphodiesterase
MSMRFTMRFTILGCGSSMGVPRVGLGWGDCDPANPKNARRRSSLLVERSGADGGVTRVLVDCSPDLRMQLIDAQVDRIDGVLMTHAHADHLHGIDDLRGLFVRNRRPVDLWMDEATGTEVRARFGYCLMSPPGSDYPPIAREHRLTVGQEVVIDGPGGPITALPLRQLHGDIETVGFRFGRVAYSADLKAIPDETAAALMGLEVWMVDALRYATHSSHLSVDEALALIERLKPGRAVLINLHCDLDYEALRQRLPAPVEPAYDGLTFEIS